jgi:hypothetical protein
MYGLKETTQMADESPIQNDNYTAKSVILVSRNQNEPLPVQLEDGKTIVGNSASNSGISQVTVPVPDGDPTHFLNGDGEFVESGGGGGGTPQRSWTVRCAAALPGSRTGLSFDGITLVDGELVACVSSSGPSSANQGVWVVNSGAWTRPTGFETGDDVCGHTIYVTDGGNIGKEYVVTRRSSTESTAIVGTDGLAHTVIAGFPGLARFQSEQFVGDETSSYVTSISDIDAGQAVVQVFQDPGTGFEAMSPDAVSIKVNGAVTLTFTDPLVLNRAYRVNITDAQ